MYLDMSCALGVRGLSFERGSGLYCHGAIAFGTGVFGTSRELNAVLHSVLNILLKFIHVVLLIPARCQVCLEKFIGCR